MAMEARQIFWQCERKVPVNVYPRWTVGHLRGLIADQLQQDYVLEEEADVELIFQGQYLDEDSVELGQTSLNTGSVVLVLSRAVAQVKAEQGKVRSVREAFQELFEKGEYSPEAQKAALQNAPPFPICGPLMDLGELGAGWPVLFNFIAFAALMLISIYIAYLPATSLYYSGEKIGEWPLADDFEHPVNSGMGSAGNLGPDGSDSSVPGWCALACAVLIVVGVFVMELRIKHVKRTVDRNEVDPNDFAIFVQGLPSDATDEEEIKQFFEANARDDEFTPVAKVVIGFDINKFNEEFEEFKGIKKERDSCADPRRRAELDAKYNNFNKLYANPQALTKNLECTGYAIVIFQYQKDQRECLDEWRSCCDRLGFAGYNSKELFRDEYALRIERADNPDDILWENLGVPWAERFMASLKTNALMALISLIGFGIIFLAQYLKQKLFQDESWPLVLGFFLIAGTNAVEVAFARKALAAEIHETKTRQDVGLMMKLTLLYTLNYAAVLFFINLPPKSHWYCKSCLVMDIFYLETMNALFYPLMLYLNMAGCIKGLLRQVMDRPGALSSQTSLNNLYEAPGMKCARVYAQILKACFLGLIYLPLVPMGTLMCGLGLVGYYWALKYYLLRSCKRPYRQSVVLATRAIQFVEFGVMLFGVSQWLFLSYSLTGSGETWSFLMMLVILGAGLLSLLSPPDCVGKLLGICFKEDTYSDVDYYNAQMAWPKWQKYHTTNAVYLFMENSYIAIKRKVPGYAIPWDPRTGDIARPGIRPAEDASSTGIAEPAPGKLAGAGDAEPDTPTSSASTADTGEDPEASSGPIAAADPAKLALEEMKYKIPTAMLGGSKDTDEDDDVISTDGEDDEADAEAPLVGTMQQGMKARISGLTASSAQKYNDTSCMIISSDSDARKYQVLMNDDKPARLPYQNLEYEAGPYSPGQKLNVVNLKKAPQYNNTTADVVGWDEKNSKYLVKLFTGAQARLSAINLEGPS